MSFQEKPDTATVRLIVTLGLLIGIAIVFVNGAQKYQKSSDSSVGVTKE
jgi:hypothetical protein